MDPARAGWSVAMVERDKIGGTCINVACIPTKSLVGSARTIVAARHAAVMGVELVGEPAVSLDALRWHKESVVGGMVDAHRTMFRGSGMDVILGTARFVAPRTVEIATDDGATQLVRGRDVVINTGTTPALPDLPGVADSDVWTSETILRLDCLPKALILDYPGQAQKMSGTLTDKKGRVVFRMPIAGHPPYKVFWTRSATGQARIEAVFPHE